MLGARTSRPHRYGRQLLRGQTVSRFALSADGTSAFPATEAVMFEMNQHPELARLDRTLSLLL